MSAIIHLYSIAVIIALLAGIIVLWRGVHFILYAIIVPAVVALVLMANSVSNSDRMGGSYTPEPAAEVAPRSETFPDETSSGLLWGWLLLGSAALGTAGLTMYRLQASQRRLRVAADRRRISGVCRKP